MAATLGTALMVAFSQIVDGEAPCDACGEPATVTLTANPDYRDTPMCWPHAREFVELAHDMADILFGGARG